jgi:hypothetical protein
MEGAPILETKRKMNSQGLGCRRFCRQVSISIGAPLGNLGRGSIYKELSRGLQKWSISLYNSC